MNWLQMQAAPRFGPDHARPAPIVRLTGILAGLAAFGLVVFFGAVIFVMTSDVFRGNAFPVDFAAFWAAAQLALDGHAIDAFDQQKIVAAITIPPDYQQERFFWMYPPTWALVTTPLGILPFWIAWPLFALISIVVYLAALRPWAAALLGQLNLVLAAPVVVLGAVNANTGLLMAGLLVFALSAMARGRWILAGLAIAAMTVKPTMGVLIPFALIAGGYWRVILWATAGALVLAALGALAFGLDYWTRFFAGILVASDQLSDGQIPIAVMVSWYAFARHVGMVHGDAILLQIGISVALMALIAWGWRRRTAIAENGALLLVAAPLATPYAHYYETALTLAGLVLWIHAGHGRRWDERAVIAALWLMPVLILFARDPAIVPLAGAPLATLMLWFVVRRGGA